MARASTYGVTSRPSVRSIQSGASKGDTSTERYVPRTQYDAALAVSREDAETRLRQQRPELFLSESQIRAKVIRDIGDQTSFGKSSRAKYISTEVQNQLSINKNSRNMQTDRLLKTMQGEARTANDRKTKEEVAAAKTAELTARNAKLAENQKARDIAAGRGNQSTTAGRFSGRDQTASQLGGGAQSASGLSSLGGGTLDAETVKYLNYLDTSARVAMKQNPELYDGFDSYASYASQLAGMPPEEREAELSALRQEANDLVDPYFETQEKRVKDDLKSTLAQMNAQFGLFKEGEQYQLDQKIDGLGRDAAEALSANFLDMKRRGVMDSGIARTIADQIIEGKIRGEDFEKNISQFRERDASMRNEFTADRARTGAERAVEDIGREKETAQQQQFFGLLSEEDAKSFLSQYENASTLKTYGSEENPSFETAIRKTAPLAGTGSTLSGARDTLLSSKAPVKKAAPAPVPPRSTMVPTTASKPVTARNSPGTTLLQRAAARAANRPSLRK